MKNEKKLREKLKWIIHPFKNSFNVPENLVDKIIEAVKESEATEPEATPEEE